MREVGKKSDSCPWLIRNLWTPPARQPRALPCQAAEGDRCGKARRVSLCVSLFFLQVSIKVCLPLSLSSLRQIWRDVSKEKVKITMPCSGVAGNREPLQLFTHKIRESCVKRWPCAQVCTRLRLWVKAVRFLPGTNSLSWAGGENQGSWKHSRNHRVSYKSLSRSRMPRLIGRASIQCKW